MKEGASWENLSSDAFEKTVQNANGAAIYCQLVNSVRVLNICIDIGDNSCFSLSVKRLTGPSTPARRAKKNCQRNLIIIKWSLKIMHRIWQLRWLQKNQISFE
ncbi:hypothetical protein TNCT_311031 [Trichonephila clavata]|uniref:Uncharacterized protein n=1 Tax=Trichonephila clavata TaxID=2740835 RepID=A0A8X6H2Y6_TRICU|nr:hypothetical protein TNCT_311031 [Trichonephila clavata]